MSVVQRGAAAATAPVGALVGLSRRDRNSGAAHQESALGGDDHHKSAGAAGTAAGMPRADGATAANAAAGRNGHAAGNGHTASGRPPRLTSGDPLHGRDVDHQDGREPDGADEGAAASAAERAVPGIDSVTAGDRRFAREPTPRDAHEDVMQRARELRERQREAAGVPEERGG
jgi:hypothetical protein